MEEKKDTTEHKPKVPKRSPLAVAGTFQVPAAGSSSTRMASAATAVHTPSNSPSLSSNSPALSSAATDVMHRYTKTLPSTIRRAELIESEDTNVIKSWDLLTLSPKFYDDLHLRVGAAVGTSSRGTSFEALVDDGELSGTFFLSDICSKFSFLTYFLFYFLHKIHSFILRRCHAGDISAGASCRAGDPAQNERGALHQVAPRQSRSYGGRHRCSPGTQPIRFFPHKIYFLCIFILRQLS